MSDLNEQHNREPQRSLDSKKQGVIIICFKRIVVELMEELSDLLTAQLDEKSNRVKVVKCGIMQKQGDGFILIECQEGFPPEFIDWLEKDGDVQAFTVYDPLAAEKVVEQ